MANIFVFANLARSSLANSINNTDTTFNVQSGGGALFPNPSPGQQFALTLTDAATGLLKEVVYVTSRVGDNMQTVVRGQEGYTALNWSSGAPVANLWTAGQAGSMLQVGQQQAQGSNYAVDTGVVNAYAGTYVPPISTPVAGMPLRLKILHTNTGASTFNPGSGLGNIVDGSGNALNGGELVANSIAEFMWNGAAYELMAPTVSAAPVLVGMIMPYGGTSAPTGYLACDGSAVNRTTFSKLFAAIGVTWGAGNGTTTFNIPNLTGKTVLGVDSGASVVPGFTAVGNTGGEAAHVLSIAEMPAHHHVATSLSGINAASTGGPVSGAQGDNTSDTGGGGAHNNIQPSAAVLWVIKT